MANITVKNLSDKVHRALRAQAARRKKSLNSYLIEALENRAEWEAKLERMKKVRDVLLREMATRAPLSDSVEILREDRDRG